MKKFQKTTYDIGPSYVSLSLSLSWLFRQKHTAVADIYIQPRFRCRRRQKKSKLKLKFSTTQFSIVVIFSRIPVDQNSWTPVFRRALAVCGLVRSRPGDLPVGGVSSEGVFTALVKRISVILQYFCILAFLLNLCLFDRLTDWGLRQIFLFKRLLLSFDGFLRTFSLPLFTKHIFPSIVQFFGSQLGQGQLVL